MSKYYTEEIKRKEIARQNERISKGLCCVGGCKKKRINARYCKFHNIAHRTAVRKWYFKVTMSGRCSWCGEKVEVKDASLCNFHKKRMVEHQRKIRKKSKEIGGA